MLRDDKKIAVLRYACVHENGCSACHLPRGSDFHALSCISVTLLSLRK